MAAELVGGAVLSSFLQVAFDRLASREILHYFQRRGLNETLVRKLKIMLMSINNVIDDAEYRQFSDSNVKAWLCELKDAMYDAEDVLDEVNYQVYKHKMEAQDETQTGVTSKVWKLFSASASSFDQEIESRMKQVLESLEFLESRKIDLGLKQSKGGAVGSVTKFPTTSLVDEDGIYGRKEEKGLMIKLLLNDKHLSVISIVGMGGLGKTTLAQLVYNDERIKSEFDVTVWVCVSDDFDVLRLTKVIFKKIMASNDSIEDLDILHNKLKDKLFGKKFLIVLDDVWCDDYISWETLLAPFIRGAAGSRILVTSRNESVALAAPSDEIYHPHELSDKDGWLLFTKYAFRNSCPQTNSDLEEIGRRIVKKCKGLPLALKTIGSLLYAKSSWEEWNSILISELWNTSCKNILLALMLSYHYLPSHLKRCFTYCSLFLKDYTFNKEELVELWMAQDFLQPSQQNKSIKEAGNEAFQELVSRSFFQKSLEVETIFVMHDIVNDLAIFVSGEFCFKQEVQEVPYISERDRHLSFVIHECRESRQFEYLPKIKKLQTFLPLLHLHFGPSFVWISSDIIFDQLCKCKYLRFLSLACNCIITEIPDSIRDLIHLRCLDLSWCQIKRLPESICLLYNLQTLKLANCIHLDELPTGLPKLKKLQQLDLGYTGLKKIPPNLGEFKNLQVRLTPFYVGECNEMNIKQIGELNLQGELSIYELQNVVDGMDALKVNLKEKMYLEYLTFQWNKNNNNDSQNERDVLEKLQPHRNLKGLSIKYYGGTRFPDWFVDNTVLPNIVSLKLKSCKYCFALPSLGLLPSLKSLFIQKLDAIVTVGAEFFGGNSSTVPFGSLETLEFARMLNWEEWDCRVASRAFPCLKVLSISDCPKLTGNLPQQLISLEDLVIKDSPQLVASMPWAPVIQRLTFGNCEHVKLEYTPSTLKALCFHGPCRNVSFLEKIEHTLNNTFIEEVEIWNCQDWEFPSKLHHESLHIIKIESCGSLRIFALDLFPAIEELYVIGCKNLEMIYVSEGCNHVPTSLTELRIEECPKFISLPERLNIFAPSLLELDIIDCPQMESFPEGGLPSNLRKLYIDRCPKLFACRTKWGLHNLGSLSSLDISGDEVVECLPKPGLLPTSLTTLWIERCSNLRMLDYNALCQAPSLKRLHLIYCPRLQCFPNEGLPNSLSVLEIGEACSELTQRCQKPKGQDWPKIAHIPDVIIY